MKRFRTDAIVLGRTNYGEAARIITFLTPDHGKVKAIAKGVRKPKSKLAGGIELFCVCDVLFLVGRGEINTVVSTTLKAHYGAIIKDLERTQLAYKLLKLINKATHEHPGAEYFKLLQSALAELDDASIDYRLIEVWFMAQLVEISGYAPNLQVDVEDRRLKEDKSYDFDFSFMRFTEAEGDDAKYAAPHIKFLRLLFGNYPPKTIQKVEGAESFSLICQPLVQTMLSNFVSI
jgi:DNA repair protein RecO (recombination protein O)